MPQRIKRRAAFLLFYYVIFRGVFNEKTNFFATFRPFYYIINIATMPFYNKLFFLYRKKFLKK